MEANSDERLVSLAVGGHRQAFAELVRRYQDCAYGVAVAVLSDFDLARDVVQESFLRAYRDLSKLRQPERFAGWLCGIVRHTAHRALRELCRVRALAEELGRQVEPFATAPSPDRCAEQAEGRRIVQRALERLTEKNREAVSLYYVAGLSYADIAGFLGVTEAAVQGRLQRARAKLRKELTMVARTFKEQELPEEFSAEVERLLDAAAERGAQRERAIQRLIAIGAPAVDPLCEALGDARISVRRAAARALCSIGDARALRPILRLLYAGDYWIASQTLRSGQVLNIPGVREELLKIVDEGEEGTRYWAITALAHARGDAEVYGRLCRCLRGDKRDAPQALSALCTLRPDKAAELITQALSDPDLRRRSGWAWWAAVRDDLLLPLKVCLGGLGRGMPEYVRRAAGKLVLRHGQKGTEALERVLRSGSRDQRAAAAVSLAPSRHGEAFEVLKAELLSGRGTRKWLRTVSSAVARHYGEQLTAWAGSQGPDRPACQAIDYTLARIRLAEGRAEELVGSGPPTVRAAALRKLARQKQAAFLPELRRYLREGRPRKIAQEAFRQMLRLGEAAVSAAIEMLGSEHWTERKAGVCLLRRWGRLTAAQSARARTDSHVAVRHAADWHPLWRRAAQWHPKWKRQLGDSSGEL